MAKVFFLFFLKFFFFGKTCMHACLSNSLVCEARRGEASVTGAKPLHFIIYQIQRVAFPSFT